MKSISYILLILTITSIFSCNQKKEEPQKPNIILIMADDMGYECLRCNGSTSYKTPVLDKMAENGIRFTQCISQPLCTPSRVKIMTGMYNYRNYEYFGYLNTNQRTFGHVMKEAGYATCIAGKWQLNGLAFDLEGYKDPTRPTQMGFDEHCLWQLTHTRSEGERFANPLLELNGEVMELDEDAYGPDVFKDFILDFIDRKKDSSFFVYFPMVLVHEPFVPTPDSEEWQNPEKRYEKDTSFFSDMMTYTDKIVGEIQSKLEEHGLSDNTLLIFTADNGTHVTITSQTTSGPVKGGKGNTIDAGTRVPLIVTWPGTLKGSKVYDGLIEFSDFFSTFANIVGIEVDCDGVSFLDLLTGENFIGRETAYVYYDPQWSKNVDRYRGQFARTTTHKLYGNGNFYNIEVDQLEEHPLDHTQLTADEARIKEKLLEILNEKPSLPEVSPETNR